jgi:hypothetical protein
MDPPCVAGCSDYHGQRDEDALVRLWREKRGEVEPEDLSGNLIVQLGVATETLNRRWGHTGQVITPAARNARKPGVDGGHPLMGVEATGAVFEAKFMLPWSFSEEAAAEKYIPHCSTTCVGGGGPAGSALGDQRGRQVGRDDRQCRPALPASDCDRRAQVLALRGDRRLHRRGGGLERLLDLPGRRQGVLGAEGPVSPI